MLSILYCSRSSSITPPVCETGWNRRPSRSPLLRSDPVRRPAPLGLLARGKATLVSSVVSQCAFILIGRVCGRRELGAVRDRKWSAAVVAGGIRGALRNIVDAVALAAAISSELRELGLEALQALGVVRAVTTKGRRWTILRNADGHGCQSEEQGADRSAHGRKWEPILAEPGKRGVPKL